VADARGNVHSYSFVTAFDLVKPAALTGSPVQSSGGKSFTYDIYNGGRFIASRTDWDGNVTTYTHDARGDETSRTEAFGTTLARTINTAWLPNFHLPTQITEPIRTTTFSYDTHGNLPTKTIPAGALTRTYSYTYNGFGQVVTSTDPRGNVTKYSYDAKGDLASITDALGHIKTIPTYDGASRPLTIIDPNGVTTTLTYDPRGRLTSRTVGTLRTAYAYDKAGNLTRVTLPDGSFLAYTYDAAHRLTQIADAVGDRIAYTLDAASNRIEEQTFYPSGTLAKTRTYIYDLVNRLSKAFGAAGETTAYTYDPQSNLKSIADPLGDRVSNRLLAITGGDSFTYDAAGNMLTHVSPVGDFRYQYDARNRLTLSYSGALATTELVNGLGQRVGRIGEDQPLYFDYDKAGHLLGQYSPGGTQTQETVWLGDLPVGVLQPTGQFYVAPDYLSAPHQITNAAGQVVWHWDHDPFGVGDPTVTGGFTYNVRFPGQFNDQRAKLNYNYFRDYDPRTGLRSAPEVDIGWCEIVQAFVVTAVIIVVDETADLGLELAWKIVVFQHDAVF
jgi:YD repeat-containing protein